MWPIERTWVLSNLSFILVLIPITWVTLPSAHRSKNCGMSLPLHSSNLRAWIPFPTNPNLSEFENGGIINDFWWEMVYFCFFSLIIWGFFFNNFLWQRKFLKDCLAMLFNANIFGIYWRVKYKTLTKTFVVIRNLCTRWNSERWCSFYLLQENAWNFVWEMLIDDIGLSAPLVCDIDTKNYESQSRPLLEQEETTLSIMLSGMVMVPPVRRLQDVGKNY